ncbi:MAG: hypothetical protein AAFY10_03950 [Pseudomonadota bacterium]
MGVVRIILATVLGLFVAAPVSAAPEDVDSSYLNLVFGHCFETSVGGAQDGFSIDVSPWQAVENFGVSETEMEGAQNVVELRFLMVGDAELMVDLDNQDICWTQASGVDAATLAARVRLQVIDGDHAGVVLDERLEQGGSGQLSRVSTLGLSEWDDINMPVLVIREMLAPVDNVLTTQVMMGQKEVQD